MKKTLILIALALLLSSCFDFLPFYKYDADPEPVTVRWRITPEGTGNWRLEEDHPDAHASAEVGFNGSNFKFAYNSESGGRAPSFGNLTAWSSHAPFYTMWEYLDIFLDNFMINSEGTFESGMIDEHRDQEYFRVNYGAYELPFGQGLELPFAAHIKGVSFIDFLDPNLLPVPGNLFIYYFQSGSSGNAFLQGEGMAIFHNGDPNGLLYMAMRHETGYVTLIYQEYNSTNSTGYYWGEMDADYSWVYFPWSEE